MEKIRFKYLLPVLSRRQGFGLLTVCWVLFLYLDSPVYKRFFIDKLRNGMKERLMNVF